ncbi:GerAB/ArcD/ProY family transporter [Paenibacillus sp. 2TAB26]|uniref:GerAB/ArcD/ProY family transporter n=1 Tax=Paenibacillus sp. 2TAB26 TaxID=3233005 RepID=UPI003F967CB1
MSKSWSITITFFAVHLSLIFFLYPENMIEIARFGQWAYILTGFTLELLFLRFYFSGLAAFPGEDLTEIVRRYGIWTARILLLPLVFYFFMSFVLLNRSHAELVTVVFLPKTPIWAILLIMLGIPLQAAIHGLKAIMRGSVILMFVVLPFILFSLVTCFQNTNLNFVFPLNIEPSFWRKESFLTGMLAHSAFLFLGMTSSKINFSSKRLRLMLYCTMGALLPLYFLANYIPLLIFGPATAVRFPFPFLSALDTVNLEWLFVDRITMFYLVSTLSFIFIYSSILQWMVATMLAKLYVPISTKVLCWAVTLLAYWVSVSIPDWEMIEQLIILDTPLRLYSIGFIPLLIFVVGITKGKGRRIQY